MNTLLMAFGGWQPIVDAPAWGVLLLKATAILLAAWLAHLALKRANPRWRVFLWRVTAVGLIAMPAIAWLLPALEIHVRQLPPVETVAAATAAPKGPLADRTVAGRADTKAAHLLPMPMSPSDQPNTMGATVLPQPQTLASALSKPSYVAWRAILLAVWLCGIAVLAFRLFIGHYRISRMVRCAKQPPQGICDGCMRVAEAVGCRTRVELLQSADISSPFLCGLRRPRLLLPAQMCDESYCRDLPGILAHELTHVRSHDVPWNVGLQLISIVLWFHPLVWRMRRAHLASCELVCDATSASFVGDVTVYCRTLARVAVDACSSLPAAGIAMARTSAVGRRLSALKERVFHLPLRRRRVLGFGFAALLAVAVIGALQIAYAAPPTVGIDHATPKSGMDATPAKTVHGKVVDENEKPIVGADVWMTPVWDPAHKRPATHATSDSEGQFTLPVVPFSDRDLQRVGWPYRPWGLWAYAAGHQLAAGLAGSQIFGLDKSDVVIRLVPAADTQFVVLAPDGKPQAGALVEPNFVNMKPHVAGELPEEVRSAVAARTDALGRANFTALPRDALGSIRVVAEGLGIQTQQLVGMGSLPAGQPIRLREAGRVVGHVTAEKPEWARGTCITVWTTLPQSSSGGPWTTNGCADVVSDGQGNFLVPAIAAGRLQVVAYVNDTLPVLPRIPDFQEGTINVQSGEMTKLEIPLEHAISVRGSVRAKDTGNVIPKSLILVYYGVYLIQSVLVCSDAQGNFVAPVLSGQIQLEVIGRPDQHIQYGTWPHFDVPKNVKEFQIPPLELVPTKNITGRLIDEHDQPVANRTICVAGATWDSFTPAYHSDAKGEFTLTGVPAPLDAAKAKYQTGLVGETSEPVEAEIVQASPLVLRVRLSAVASPPRPDPAGAASKGNAKPTEAETQPAKDANSGSRTGSLLVRVVDEIGKPIAGARLHADCRGKKLNAVTDAEGQCALAAPSPDAGYIYLYANVKGFVPLRKYWTNQDGREPRPAEFTFNFPKGRTIGGVVRNEQGKPIQGAMVRLSISSQRYADEGVAMVLWDRDFTTDADGRWHLDHVPETITSMAIHLGHPDYIVEGFLRQVTAAEQKQIEDRTSVIVMNRGITVTGTVTDPEGKPVANALVAQGDDRIGGSHFPTTRTDQEGNYRFGSLALGGALLTVISPGMAPAIRNLNVQPGMALVDFRLTKGNLLRARVVDKDNHPLQGVFISPDTWRGHRTLTDLGIPKRTDAEGRWRWSWAPTDAVEMQISKDGYMSPGTMRLAPQDTEQVITLYPALTITGHVVDAGTKRPISTFHVVPGCVVPQWADKTNWNRREMAEGKNGQYKVVISRPFTRPAPTSYLVRVEADDYQPALSRGFKSDEGSVNCDFSLSKGNVFNVSVHLPDGKPAAGADVCLCPEKPGKFYNMATFVKNGQFAYKDNYDSTKTYMKVGANGQLPIEPQDNGFLLIVIHDKGFAQTTSEDLKAKPEITLKAWARLEGVVRHGAKPASNAKLDVYPSGSNGGMRWGFLTFQDQVGADADGKFVFPKLKPGTWHVRLLPVDQSGRSPNEKSVELPPGQTVHVTLGGEGRPITGRIQWPNGVLPDGDLSHIMAGIAPKICTF